MTTTTPKPRLKDLALSTTEVFHLPHSALSVAVDYNPREDFAEEHEEELALTILSAGRILVPLVVKKVTGESTVHLQDGERRWRAVGRLIRTGRVPADFPLPCISEPKHGCTQVDRLLLPLMVNTGRPLNMIEKGRQYQRLLAQDGMTQAEIARRLPGTTKQAVSNAITLVEKGAEALLFMVRDAKLASTTALDIVKQHPDDPAAQIRLADEALVVAAESGRAHATPKDLPKPPPKQPPTLRFEFGRSIAAGSSHAVNEHGVFTTPDTCTITGMPRGWKFIELSLRVAKRPEAGAWSTGGTVSMEGGIFSGTPVMANGRPFGSERDAWIGAWEYLLDRVNECLGKPGLDHEILYGLRSAAPQFLDALETHLSAPAESHPQDPPDPSHPTYPTDLSPVNLSFLPFELVGRPTECSGTGDYQELYRFVLTGIPTASPLEHCHLLLAPDHLDPQTWYVGWRFYLDRLGDIESLPNVALKDRQLVVGRTFHGAIDMLVGALDELIDGTGIDLPFLTELDEVWAACLDQHLTSEGDFDTIDFDTIAWVAKADPRAFEQIKEAPSTNRDGSAISLGNDGGYADPSKRMIEADKLLEELAGTVHAGTISYTVLEVTLAYLRGERSRADLKKFLTQS